MLWMTLPKQKKWQVMVCFIMFCCTLDKTIYKNTFLHFMFMSFIFLSFPSFGTSCHDQPAIACPNSWSEQVTVPKSPNAVVSLQSWQSWQLVLKIFGFPVFQHIGWHKKTVCATVSLALTKNCPCHNKHFQTYRSWGTKKQRLHCAHTTNNATTAESKI